MKQLIIAVFLCYSSFLFCSTLYVNLLVPTNASSHIYNTINEAYTAAVNGDIIEIYPGDYMESLTITKIITIRGNTSASTRIVRNNTTGFTISCTTGNVSITNLCFIVQGDSGIKMTTGCLPVTISNCIFDTCESGINVQTVNAISIRNSIMRNCSNGVYTNLSATGIITNCIFHNNSDGIELWASVGSNVTMNIFNSIFTNNTRGIYKSANAGYSGDLAYNIFYLNTSSDSGVTLGSGNITGINANPLLGSLSSPYSYFPSTSSPCLNAGNPMISYNDLDNSRNDIGIYGGPYQYGNGKPVVLNIQLNPNPVQQGGTFNLQAIGQTK